MLCSTSPALPEYSNHPSHGPILKTLLWGRVGERSNVYMYDIPPETSDSSSMDTHTQTNPFNGQLVPNHILFHESYNRQRLDLAGPVKNTLTWAAGHLVNREPEGEEIVRAERRTYSL